MIAIAYHIPSRLESELAACGWTKANEHFERACDAAIARDDAAYAHEMAEFNRIKATWGDRELRKRGERK